MESYRQTFTVSFRSARSAGLARLRIAPLFHDFVGAFSTRMDDNNANVLAVSAVMARHGHQGTFFLNDLAAWWEDNAVPGGPMVRNPGLEIPRQLLAAGHSIGGHTLNHEFLPALSKNAAFREIMAGRVALEVGTGSFVSAFAYPFMYFQSPLRAGADRADLEEILRRSGYLHLSENRYNASGESPGLHDGLLRRGFDGEPADGSGEPFRARHDRRRGPPTLYLVAMHAWIKQWGGPGFPKLEAQYQKWAESDALWRCNQNQFAAYRSQVRESRLEVSVDGNALNVVVHRPDPVDLGDLVPLTFMLDGIEPRDVASVDGGGARVAVQKIGDAFGFDLHHDSSRGLPSAYGEASNAANDDQTDAAKGLLGLGALLFRRGPTLTLFLRNGGERPISEIRATFRLPLRWGEGVCRQRVPLLQAGESTRIEIRLTERTPVIGYADGTEYLVAQVDFTTERRARLYATCEVDGGAPPSCCSHHGFLVLGPIPGDMAEVDPQFFAGPHRLAGFEKGPTSPWGRSLSWRVVDPSGAAFLEGDIIPTTGKSTALDVLGWHSSGHFPHTRMQFLLHGLVVSPDAREARAVFDRDRVRQIVLNREVLDGGSMVLAKGTNDLRLLYTPPLASESQFNENNYGCYFRITDAAGQRMTDIRFERPPAA